MEEILQMLIVFSVPLTAIVSVYKYQRFKLQARIGSGSQYGISTEEMNAIKIFLDRSKDHDARIENLEVIVNEVETLALQSGGNRKLQERLDQLAKELHYLKNENRALPGSGATNADTSLPG